MGIISIFYWIIKVRAVVSYVIIDKYEMNDPIIKKPNSFKECCNFLFKNSSVEVSSFIFIDSVNNFSPKVVIKLYSKLNKLESPLIFTLRDDDIQGIKLMLRFKSYLFELYECTINFGNVVHKIYLPYFDSKILIRKVGSKKVIIPLAFIKNEVDRTFKIKRISMNLKSGSFKVEKVQNNQFRKAFTGKFSLLGLKEIENLLKGKKFINIPFIVVEDKVDNLIFKKLNIFIGSFSELSDVKFFMNLHNSEKINGIPFKIFKNQSNMGM